MNDDLKYLVQNKFFDYDGFMIALMSKEPAVTLPFVRKIILNILNDAAYEWNYDDGTFLSRVCMMIPGVDLDFISIFADPLMINTPI